MAIALSGSLILSGSITVSGSIITTGTISMSGSIASASYANNATTASYALNATTGAYANTATSASYALNATTFNGLASSIFATTGSNTFIGTQTITGSVLQSGSFTTTGTIIAQTINVQQVTSSIVYSCGSNIFGTSISNTQQLTGSVGITGSLTIAGASSATSYNGATIFGSTIACSPIGCFATSCATSFIGGTLSGTTIYGSTAVCSPVGKFSTCIDAGAGTFSGTLTDKATNISADGAGVVLQGYVDNNLRIAVRGSGYNDGARGGLYASTGDFSGTITGTTIYGSTAVCSPVGLFSGCVGINCSAPSGKLQVANSSTQYALYTAGGNLELYTPEGNCGYVRLGSAYNLNGVYGGCGLNYLAAGTSNHVFYTTDGPTERMRISCSGNLLATGGRISNARCLGTWQDWVGNGITLGNNVAIALYCINGQYDNLIVDLVAWIDQGAWSPVNYRYNIGYNVGTSYVSQLGNVSAICGITTGTTYNETWCWKNCSGNGISNSSIVLRIFGHNTAASINTGGSDLIISSYLTRIS